MIKTFKVKFLLRSTPLKQHNVNGSSPQLDNISQQQRSVDHLILLVVLVVALLLRPL